MKGYSESPKMVPFYLQGSKGKLFAVNHIPDREDYPLHAVLIFAPFAEEMNKSRRMMALQARRLAGLGYSVLLVDYFGTGDSEGDFSQANWEIWQQDMFAAFKYLKEHGCQKISFIGLRLGALLAMQIYHLVKSEVEQIIFWQPVLSGQVFMNQFLRLRVAADMISTSEKITTTDLRNLLNDGQAVEIAGYTITPELFAGIESLQLQKDLENVDSPIFWFELLQNEDRPLPVAANNLIEQSKKNGVNITAKKVKGENFWNTPEITIIDELLVKTTTLFA